MFLKQAIRSTMFACVLLSACGHSGDDDPQPVKPEPDPPVEETYLTVATRDGASVEAYDLTFAAFEQTLVVRSNVRWDVSAGDAAAWLHVTAASAATARVSIDVNTGREVRSGKIVFTTEDAKVRIEIPVTQRFGETIGRAPIRDLMLIYDATDTGRLFDEKRFAKYLATTDDAPQWLFDGYLFLTLHRGGKSFGAGYKKPASNKKDWEAVLDYYLADEHSIPALDRAAGELRAKIGGTFHRRKVVIFLPDPQEGQTDWGEIDGRALDFNNYPDRIAACKYSRLAGRPVFLFCHNAFPTVGLQPFCSGRNQRIGGGSQRHNHGIQLQIKFRTWNLHGSSSAGFIRFSQLHTDAGHPFDPSVLIHENLFGIGQQIKNNPFLFCMVHLFHTGWKLFLTSSIHNMNLCA